MKQKCAYMRSWLKVLILTVRKLQISCCQLSFSMWSTLFMADWLYPIKGIHIICKNTLSWIILLNASRILRYKLFFRRLIKISIKSIFFKYILRCKNFFQLHEGVVNISVKRDFFLARMLIHAFSFLQPNKMRWWQLTFHS